MNQAIMRSTQVSVTLAINVQVRRHNQAQLVTFSLFPLTVFVMFIWQATQAINRVLYWWATLTDDIQAAVSFAVIIWLIGFNSLAFGLGVKL